MAFRVQGFRGSGWVSALVFRLLGVGLKFWGLYRGFLELGFRVLRQFGFGIPITVTCRSPEPFNINKRQCLPKPHCVHPSLEKNSMKPGASFLKSL